MRKPTLAVLRTFPWAVFLATGIIGPPAAAFSEVGTKVEPEELPAAAGGKAALLSPSARANVLVFFRADQDRSIKALRQLAACERELGKAVHWAAVVPGSASAPEARAAAASAGVQMPVLLDEGDKLLELLQVRLSPAVVITDGKGVLRAVEPYRQLDFGEAVRAQVRFVLGEIDQAALARALNPEVSRLPGEDPIKKAMRDVNMSRRLISLGKYDAAVKQAQKALERAPVQAAYPVLATAYAKLGRCDDAAKALDQARKVAADPKEIAEASALCAGK
jgi:tetratricopeptide (TPR) repeat protein